MGYFHLPIYPILEGLAISSISITIVWKNAMAYPFKRRFATKFIKNNDICKYFPEKQLLSFMKRGWRGKRPIKMLLIHLEQRVFRHHHQRFLLIFLHELF